MRRLAGLQVVATTPRVSGPDEHSLDLRGVPCPVTWARAKVALEALPRGARVLVITDDERSARDLPVAAESEGYAVLDITREGGTTRIRIER